MRRRIRRDHHHYRYTEIRSVCHFSLSILEIRKASYRRDAEAAEKNKSKKKTRRSPRLGGEKPLSLHRQQERLLKRLRDPPQKARGIRAIDQPVIVRERQRKNQRGSNLLFTHSGSIRERERPRIATSG